MNGNELNINEYAAEIAYFVYCKACNWKSDNGDPLPLWQHASDEVKLRWGAVADALEDHFIA